MLGNRKNQVPWKSLMKSNQDMGNNKYWEELKDIKICPWVARYNA